MKEHKKIYDIVIIGAGISGLIAATELIKQRYSVLVLEGSDRIGGRVHDASLAGIKVPMGAAWLHNLDVPEILPYFTSGFFPDTQSIRIFPNGAISQEQLKGRLDSVYASPLDVNTKDRHVSEYELRPFLGDYLLFGHGDAGIHSNDLSLRETSHNNSQAGLIPLAGFAEMVDSLQKPLLPHILKKQIVTNIHSGKHYNHVLVSGTEKPLLTKRVLVTASLGALLSDKISFTHSDSEAFVPHTIQRLKSRKKLTMGCFEKVHFLVSGYNNLLERNNLHNDCHIHIYDPDLGPMLLKTHTDGDKPVLTCYLGAEIAEKLLKEGGEKEFTEFALHLARKHLGHFDVEASICSDWISNPLFLGSYSSALKGGYNKRDVSAENLHDLKRYGICFAGEAIPPKDCLHLATQVPGAFKSGENAAEMLVKSLGVSRALLMGRERPASAPKLPCRQ